MVIRLLSKNYWGADWKTLIWIFSLASGNEYLAKYMALFHLCAGKIVVHQMMLWNIYFFLALLSICSDNFLFFSDQLTQISHYFFYPSLLYTVGNFALSYFCFRLVVPIYTKRQHQFKSERLHRGKWRPNVPFKFFFYRMGTNDPNSNNGICRTNSPSSWSARVGLLAVGCSVEPL